MTPKPQAREVDSRAQKTEFAAGMRQPASRKRKKLDYPVETEGSRIATAVRREASKLTSEQRRDLFKRALVRIYGGKPKTATVAGH